VIVHRFLLQKQPPAVGKNDAMPALLITEN